MSSLHRKDPRDFHTRRLEGFDSGWRCRKLASGLTLLHVPLPHDDRFFLGAMIKAGSRLERHEHAPGVSHFLEHMMFRGSKKFPEFTKLAEAFEWLGGDWNAATGQEHTEYVYSGIRHTAPEITELFVDFLENPELTDIEIERNIILRELDGETNEHGNSTDIDHHIATMIWPGSTMAQPILGTRESLAAISREDLTKYRDAFYVPRNMALCAVGGDESMLDILEQHAATLRMGFGEQARVRYEPLPTFKGPMVKWVLHSDNEYEIKLSFICGGEWSEDAQAYEIIARILSDGFCSRLARRLREELGLVYDISASTALGLDAGTLDISATCAQDGLDEFLRELFLLLRTFAAEGPTESELQRSVVRAVVDLELSPTLPEVVGTRLAWAIVAEKRLSLVEERSRLEALTAPKVARLCREIIRPENAALAVLGPEAQGIEKRLKKALISGLA